MEPIHPLLQNILAQPESLVEVFDTQFGEGLPALKQAAQAIGKAGRVVFAAMGASYFACIPAVAYLTEHGVPAALVDAGELLHYSAGSYPSGTVFVLVSRSGESVEITRLLPVLKQRGGQVVGITNVSHSPLAREADISLLVGSLADQLVAVQSYTGTLLALCLLAKLAARQSLPPFRAEVDRLIEWMARAIPEYEAASRDWRPFFTGVSVVYLLARGKSLASAAEGALLFHEVAKFPAVNMDAGNFRHGPVEVVEEGFRCMVFAPADSTRELNLSLAQDLAALGGQVRMITPTALNGQVGGLESWPAPDVSPLLAPLGEVVPIQLACYRLAEWRGITSGDFRYLGQVTLEERGFSKRIGAE